MFYLAEFQFCESSVCFVSFIFLVLLCVTFFVFCFSLLSSVSSICGFCPKTVISFSYFLNLLLLWILNSFIRDNVLSSWPSVSHLDQGCRLFYSSLAIIEILPTQSELLGVILSSHPM